MSFNVIFSSKPRYYGYISYFSTGPNGTITCRSQVSLQAEIIGDLTGHTLLWEQVAGDPVTFLTDVENNLSMTFEYDIKDDKLFRLWLDKGTPFERYDDVWAWSTPTERHYVTSRVNGAIAQKGRPYADTSLDNSHEHVIIEFTDLPTSLRGYAGLDLNKALFWTLPSVDKDRITHYIIQRWISGAWVDFALVGPEIRYVPIENGYNYRIQTYFQIPEKYGQQYYISTSETLRVDGETQFWGTSAVFTGSARVPENTHNYSGYDVLQRFLISHDPDWSDAPSSNVRIPSHTQVVNSYDVLQRYATQLNPVPFSLATNSNVLVPESTHTVTNYTVLELINIEIGSTTNIQIGG